MGLAAGLGVVAFSAARMKRARGIAEKNEKRYRTLLELSPDAVLLGRHDAIVMANKAAANLLGASSTQELLGKKFTDFVSQESLTTVEKLRSDLYSGRKNVPYREIQILRGGKTVTVGITASSCRDEDGTTVQCVIRDLSSRKRAEQALRLSEARLRAITDSAQDAIVMMDPRGTISYWNPAAEAILGYNKAEAIGRDLHALLISDGYKAANGAAMPKFLRTGRGNLIGKTTELTACHKDGREIAVDLSLSAICLNAEWHAVGMLRDITRRKEAEQALRESEEKFRQLAESIHEVFFVQSADAEVVYVSPAYEQIWGRSCESVYRDSKSWQSAIHPDDLERVRRRNEAFPSLGPDELEYRIRTPDGVEKWIRSRMFPVWDQNGNLNRAVGICEEITEHKQYEQQLIQAREGAEAANRAKSMFIASMSHELRTPLNAILGFTELLELEMADQGIHRWDKDVERIRRAGNHLLALISDVLDVSKIEAGKIELQPESFDLAGLIEEIAAGAEPLAMKNHIKIQVFCTPATVYGDRVRIGQCLINLVGNACKFTRGGQVMVEALREAERGDWWQVRVSDTGIGIRPEDLDKLFRYFSQIEISDSRKYAGTGLGLAISRKLARLMGGDITVESVFGEGSTFILHFPAGNPALAAGGGGDNAPSAPNPEAFAPAPSLRG